jgi:hypothetical protein
MHRPEKWLLMRRYKEALAQAEKGLAGRSSDKGWLALRYGQALLLGSCEKAKCHFEKFAKEYRFCGLRVGSLSTYAGLANWFLRKHDEAFQHWESGLRAAYQARSGMEIPWVMLYAAARHPESSSWERAVHVVQDKSKRFDTDGSALT